MNYSELFIAIGLILVVTIGYVLIRKFVSWYIEDENKWNRKHGYVGLSKDTRNVNRKIAFDRITEGYLLLLGVLVLYIIKLIMDAT